LPAAFQAASGISAGKYQFGTIAAKERKKKEHVSVLLLRKNRVKSYLK